jgi:hypothetical protein
MQNSPNHSAITIALVSLAVLLLVAVVLTMATLKLYLEDRQYEAMAVRTDGWISSYTYSDGGRGKNAQLHAGHFANVSFSTPQGTITVTSEKRYQTPEHRAAMLGWAVDVWYLPGQPQRARIVQWWEPQWSRAVPLLLLLLVGIVGLGHLLYSWWRPMRSKLTSPSLRGKLP